jgi:hypothetical protein
MKLARAVLLAGVVTAAVALAQTGPTTAPKTDSPGASTGNVQKMDGGTKMTTPNKKHAPPPGSGETGK